MTRPLATPLALRPLGTLRPLEDFPTLLTRTVAVMVGDMNWDGEPIGGMSEDEATLLTSLRPQPGGSS